MRIILTDSLEKVLYNTKECRPINKIRMMKNGRAAVQIVFVNENPVVFDGEISTNAKSKIVIRREENVVAQTRFREVKDNYRITESELFPDVLMPLGRMKATLRGFYTTVFWVDVSSPVNECAKFSVKVNGETTVLSLNIEVLNAELPQTDLVYTDWVHCDCLCDYYNVVPFSDEFYKIYNSFVGSAVAHGMTMLYVPLFTPALDTEINHERMTVQLVDITQTNGKYQFDFTALNKFIINALGLGVSYFELSHLFSQWGAEKTPKIIVNGKKKFGWDTVSDGDEYFEFLSMFLPKLKQDLIECGVYEKTYFHISDEPNDKCLSRYEKLSSFCKKYIDRKFIDALSHFEFYEKGLVDIPVVATNATKEFIDNDAYYFAYYCCGQYQDGLSNRFIDMPSLRTRIIGLQLYYNNAKGLLHWGYNFYYTYLSREKLNPFLTLDAGGAFPAGDSFIVYPGDDGSPLDSIRHQVLAEGLDDYRLCLAAEKKVGREAVLKLLKDYGMEGYTKYPHDENAFFEVIDKLQKIAVK